MFQDLVGVQLKPVLGDLKHGSKFIKFGLWSDILKYNNLKHWKSNINIIFILQLNWKEKCGIFLIEKDGNLKSSVLSIFKSKMCKQILE